MYMRYSPFYDYNLKANKVSIDKDKLDHFLNKASTSSSFGNTNNIRFKIIIMKENGNKKAC